MKIFVLMGGTSSEKNVSIKTGKAIAKALSLKYSNVKILKTSFPKDLRILNSIQKGDIVFNALHGGAGENGDIQSFFDLNNILYTGSGAEASRICMNKHLSKLVAQSEGVSTPDWIFYKHKNFSNKKLFNIKSNKFHYPYIVKPNGEGSTVGIAKVDKDSDLEFALASALELSSEVMIEDYISGRELTVGILGDKPLPIVEIFPSNDFYDYECKYSKGMSKYKVPADINSDLELKIKEDALLMHRAIGCRHYSRVDFILDGKNKHYFLEINSLPGMTSTSLFPMAAKSAGLEFQDLIDTILKMALIDYD